MAIDLSKFPGLRKPTPNEARLIARLNTPLRVQHFLDGLAYNHETPTKSIRTLRRVLRARKAHCLEAALFAARILECHGHPPLLLDLCSKDKLDHVLFLFQERGRWGTVARSRDPGLHGRKPVFATVEALVRSYVLPYIDRTGRIRRYGVFDLRTLNRVDWRTSSKNVWAVEEALRNNPSRRIKTSDREYRKWRRRYIEYMTRHPDQKPLYYPGRARWLSSGPSVIKMPRRSR